MLDDRAFAVHCARVFLSEAARRRHSYVNRNFYWTLIKQAQQARREATAMIQQAQLFA